MWEAILRALGAFYGVEPYSDLTADETKAAIIEAPSKLDFLEIANPNAHDVFIQLFDSLLADVTVGTTTPTFVHCIPAGDGSYHTVRAPIDRSSGSGVRFQTGMCYAITKESDGSTAPDAPVVLTANYQEV